MNFKKIVWVIIVIILMLTGCSKKKDKNLKSTTDKVIRKISSSTQMALGQIDKVKEQSEKQLDIIKDASKKKIDDWGKTTKETKKELWERYNKTKEAINFAKSKGNYKELVELLKKEAKTSEKLGRKDIQAWQLNNVGYYSIEEFKKKTGYDERMKQFAQIKDSKQRKKYYKETISLLKKYKKILDDSYPYLLEAKKLDKEVPDKKRKKIISNNISFVNDIKRLMDKAKNNDE